MEILIQSANRGDGMSQRRLAYSYDLGLYGLKRNPKKAIKWYQKILDAGESISDSFTKNRIEKKP